MVQVGSNPLSSASIGTKLSPGIKDLTPFEASFSHRNKHRPGLAYRDQLIFNTWARSFQFSVTPKHTASDLAVANVEASLLVKLNLFWPKYCFLLAECW